MTDNQLIQLFLPLLKAGLAAPPYNLLDLQIVQNYQPQQQGLISVPTLYFQKVPGGKNYGFLGRNNLWNVGTTQEDHVEQQYKEATYQFMAMVTQEPSNVNQMTSSDLADYAAAVLGSDACRTAVSAGGAAILRIQELPNPYILDDHDRFVAVANFSVTFQYLNVVRTSTNVVQLPISSQIKTIQ
jgi:hypothetical protein